MSEHLNLNLLILCAILCQGIFATLSEEHNRESSNDLVRKRRVISHLPNGLNPTCISVANYMVTIKERKRSICVGVILSHYSVLTAAICVDLQVSVYTVLSGSGYDERSISHSVESKATFFGYPPQKEYDGIAMITVDPPFVFNRNTGYIHLLGVPLAAGTEVTVRGWGCGYSLQPCPVGTRRRLRSITLPIMNHGECQHEYRNYFNVTEKYICTYHEHQYCARTDAGAPVIFNNMLAGIHVYKGQHLGRKNPDVYIDLHRLEYSTWIREQSILM